MALKVADVKFVLAILCFVCMPIYTTTGHKLNDRPIIGVMAQETPDHYAQFGPSVVAASYVKFVESAGARAVLVRINQPLDYYKKIYKSINGLLLPGGVPYPGYSKAAEIMFDLSIEGMKKGDYFPIWGICAGFQMLACIVAGEDVLKAGFDSENLPLPLDITSNFVSHIFDVSATPGFVLEALIQENSTFNNHIAGITPKNFTKFGLDKFFKVISVNKDRNGIEFISTIEAHDYPIYGVQWHPEKNIYEWNIKTDFSIPHSPGAIGVTQHCANFFVNEARKSNHRFETEEEAAKYLVYNYQPVYVGNVSTFEQAYFPDV